MHVKSKKVTEVSKKTFPLILQTGQEKNGMSHEIQGKIEPAKLSNLFDLCTRFSQEKSIEIYLWSHKRNLE